MAQAVASPNIIGNRYRLINKIGEGGMGIVYRVQDRLTSQTIALKQVNIYGEHLLADTAPRQNLLDLRVALAREFKTLASLRHPNIISVLDYGFNDQHQPYFTMEYLQGARNILHAAQNQPFEIQVHLLIQLLQALAYLHRRGVIHRDMKPDNVLVIGYNIVKVLDFGLSAARDYKSEHDAHTSGTLAYMAPEVLSGGRATPLSDLYAVGMMAYEMFTGKYPFSFDNVTQLIQDIVQKMPEIEQTPLRAGIKIVLDRLLAKSPDARYPTASEAVKALQEVAARPYTLNIASALDSYLQAADFVGRENEVQRLTQKMNEAIKGEGSAWLIGGESGVGKSRLLDELRTLGLVEGATVLRGQGIGEGGSPYALWRDTLRWLAISTELTELEASVLKAIIPDIADLLGRPVEHAPDLPPAAMQTRIINVIEDIFRRYLGTSLKPLVVQLEDIHWAGSESLKVLERLTRVANELPCLIMASYRDDEVPTLPNILPHMQDLKLQRLDDAEIEKLSAAMLGDGGKKAEVVDLLQRETDGNIFFVIEVIRALAEETGDIDRVGQRTLPQNLFKSGVRTIIQRRLKRIPDEARDLLQIAAIMGRQLDLRLLEVGGQTALKNIGSTLEEWLTMCSDAAILTVQDDQWHFAHDKLRDGLLETLTSAQKQSLHRRSAEAIEEVYHGQPEHYAALTHHYAEASDQTKEMHYAGLAGELALANGAYREAIRLLERALTLAETCPLPAQRQAVLERKLSATYLALGNMQEGLAHSRTALELFEYPLPANHRAMALGVAKQLIRQMAHRLLPFVFVGKSKSQYERLTEAALTNEQLSEVAYYTNDSLMGVYVTLRTLNLAERTRPSPQLARSLGAVSYVSLLVNNSVSAMYGRRARKVALQVGDPYGMARSLHLMTLGRIGVGDWDVARRNMEQVIAQYEELGEQRYWTMAAQSLAQILYYTGDFPASLRIAQRIGTAALRYGDIQAQGFGKRGEAMNYLIMGHTEEAAKCIDAAIPHFAASNDRIGEMDSWGVLALANLRQDRVDYARQNAKMALDLAGDKPPSSYNAILGFASIAEAILTLLEAQPKDNELRALCERAVKTIQGYARRYPMGKARALIYTAWLDWLIGQPDKARGAWQNAIKTAQTMRMPYDEAFAKYLAGKHLNLHDYLVEALHTFNRIGADYDAERTRELLG